MTNNILNKINEPKDLKNLNKEELNPHKILTGRKEKFINPEKFRDITEYTSQHESEHDLFTVGL